MKVSVVMPVYNGEKFLRPCLDSVVGQTLRDIEIICVDDGSTDSAPSILQEYASRDARVKIIHQKNSGAGAARNNGMSIATGDFLSFLDSDDVFEATMLEKLYAKASSLDLDVTVCRCERFATDSGKKTKYPWSIRENLLPGKEVFAADEIKKNFFMAFIWWPWDKLYKKSYVQKLGITFQNLRTTNDLFFVASAMLNAKKIGIVNEVLVHQRVGSKSSLSVTREKSWDCFHTALIELRSYMREHGLYKRFEQDFINYALHFSFWHLETLQGKPYGLLYNKLRDEWFAEFGILDKQESYFYDPKLYKMMRYVITTDLTEHLGHRTGKLEQMFSGKKELSSAHKLSNMYMRVKLYYKGYGLIATIRKIWEKI